MLQPSTSTLAVSARHRLGSLLRDYWQLSRPRIVGLVLFAMAITALVCGGETFSWRALLHAILGSTAVIVGAIALNARLERTSDAQMLRTSRRPLPAGRLSRGEVTVLGIVASLVGIIYLALWGNGPTVALAAISWLIYVWVYTPLKLFTAWQTPIGALTGALPVLLGSAAVGKPLHPTALALFGMLYFWQFPHAMAIAWLYRHEFAAARLRVATVVDPSGRTAAWLALAGAVVLVPLSLAPALLGTVGWGYGLVALAVALGYLLPAVQFFRRRDDSTARRLLLASFAYVPVVFLAILVAATWR